LREEGGTGGSHSDDYGHSRCPSPWHVLFPAWREDRSGWRSVFGAPLTVTLPPRLHFSWHPFPGEMANVGPDESFQDRKLHTAGSGRSPPRSALLDKLAHRRRFLKIKVAILLTQPLDPTLGGVQRSSWHLGHALGREGFGIEYISLSSTGHRRPEIGELHHPPPNPGQSSALWIREVLGKAKPDIVINQCGFDPEISRVIWEERASQNFGVIACYRNNPSWYRENIQHVTRHQLRNRKALRTLVDHPLGWQILRAKHVLKNRRHFRNAVLRSDRFMLLAPSFVDELRWYVPDLDESKIFVAPNAFDPPDQPRGEKKQQLLFVGRLEHAQKQVLLLPEIWSRLAPLLPEWELVVVGDGPDRKQLEREFKARGLSRWSMEGRQKPNDYYRTAPIFLMTSRYEGFGNTLVEAQMFGCVPVMFNGYSAAPWLMNHQDDAILVDPYDVERFSAEVLSLARDPERLARMSEGARRNAKRFSSDTLVPRWIEMIHEIIRERKAS